MVWLEKKPTPVCTYPGNIFFYYYYAAYFEYTFFAFMKNWNWINQLSRFTFACIMVFLIIE